MKPKVYVVGGGYSYERMFKEHGFELTDIVHDAGLLCFTGGSDVSPSLYGEASVASYDNPRRDQEESSFFTLGKLKELPMVGICRGAQFLNVMSGGRMWQDVDNHAVYGTHSALCKVTGEEVQVTSTHHQMMRPSDKGEILVSSSLATTKQDQLGIHQTDGVDAEVVYYRATNCLCYQPHPEMVAKGHECREHFMVLLNLMLLGEL